MKLVLDWLVCGVLKSHRSLASSARGCCPAADPQGCFHFLNASWSIYSVNNTVNQAAGEKLQLAFFFFFGWGGRRTKHNLFLTHKKAGRLKLVRTYRPPAVADSYLSQLAVRTWSFSAILFLNASCDLFDADAVRYLNE